ncbi:MAG: hypothetical protein AB9M53_01060 [Leptothrix sp. (in: b-proteobacteria)]
MALSEGQTARLIQPVIEGPILDTRYNKDAGELEHLVTFTDADGEEASRWFLASKLEAA